MILALVDVKSERELGEPMIAVLQHAWETSANLCPDFRLYCECIRRQHTKLTFRDINTELRFIQILLYKLYIKTANSENPRTKWHVHRPNSVSQYVYTCV